MSNKEITLSGRLDGRQRNRLKSLLNMMYRPSELASEVGFSQNEVYRVYVPLGCPHERDDHNHIWINGKEFHDWYNHHYQKHKLKENEAFCLTCKKAVKMVNPIEKKKEGLSYWVCYCPVCNRKLSKIITQKRIWKDDKSG